MMYERAIDFDLATHDDSGSKFFIDKLAEPSLSKPSQAKR